MTTNLKATYAIGVFTPVEPVDLEEGAEAMVSMDGTPREFRAAAERYAERPDQSWTHTDYASFIVIEQCGTSVME
ncbi:MAG: antitoxin family protein [Chloroflexi bacterium]|nr:antitoxin family protein [Chloroflexota bacterium]